MATQHWRHLWRGARSGDFDVWWDAIQHDSYVVITVAEAGAGDFALGLIQPVRHVGDAKMFVCSIAPKANHVLFYVHTGWESPLDIWTDITVF